MGFTFDVATDLARTIFDDWGVDAEYVQTSGANFSPSDGSVTPSQNTYDITVVRRPVSLSTVADKQGLVQLGDEAFLVRFSDLGFEPTEGDYFVIDGVEYKVRYSDGDEVFERLADGAMLRVFVEEK